MKGLLGKKVGMTQIFDANGEIIPVTIIKAGPCYVTQVRTPERDGYRAYQLGFEEVRAKRLTGGQKGHLGLLKGDAKHQDRKTLAEAVPPLRYLREFRLHQEEDDGWREGEKITVSIFEEGDHVDIVGTSKGRGTAGVMKRHGFGGGPRTHGQSDRQRAPGSISATTTPGRVFKGTRMAGRMGNDRITAQNLLVVAVDPERDLLAVRGSVPGGRNGLVMIRAAKKGSR
jgi:large subunit ribosomal protein L3